MLMGFYGHIFQDEVITVTLLAVIFVHRAQVAESDYFLCAIERRQPERDDRS